MSDYEVVYPMMQKLGSGVLVRPSDVRGVYVSKDADGQTLIAVTTPHGQMTCYRLKGELAEDTAAECVGIIAGQIERAMRIEAGIEDPPPATWGDVPHDAIVCMIDPRDGETLVRVLRTADTATAVDNFDTETFHPEDDTEVFPLWRYYLEEVDG